MKTIQEQLGTQKVTLSQEEVNQYLQFALELADLAATVTLPLFRTSLDNTNKTARSYFDPVTQADIEAERVIRQRIQTVYPDHGILGEEEGFRASKNGMHWVLDPVDGTRSFICGVPMWTTLIGLYAGDRPVLGLASQPFTGEVFYGTPEASFWQKNKVTQPLQASNCSILSQAKLVTTGVEYFSALELTSFERVKSASLMTRYGTDAYGYCLLASGQVDVVMESGLQFYDYLPLLPILQGAGVVVTDWEGEQPIHESQAILATATESLNQSLLELIR